MTLSATTRRTYSFTVVASIEVDDERLVDVQRIVQEQVNVFYHRLEREDDVRVVFQRKCEVVETR
jgi:hypothetical protein